MSHPSDDELEVSVFGPGIGESIAVHLGRRQWIIVDSCCDTDDEPAAITYLEDIGVDTASEVKLIVASHWHDDHIRGISKVYSKCFAARFSCAGVLRKDEFCTLVVAYGEDPMIKHKGVREFYRIFCEMQELPSEDPRRNPIWALENKTLLHEDGRYSVKALSPSDEAVTQALQDMSAFLPKDNEPTRNLISENANHAAVVLSVTLGIWNILLASDLQHTANPLLGWTAIVNSPGRTKSKAALLKIPHHGSETGNAPGIWTDLVCHRPLGVVTPYNRGVTKLPTKKSLKLLSKSCSQLYYTALPTVTSPPRRSPAVEKTLKMVALERKVVESRMGQVRLRASINGPDETWTEELFGDAGKSVP